jgi:quercetin dioxygenase-like cupin family protein
MRISSKPFLSLILLALLGGSLGAQQTVAPVLKLPSDVEFKGPTRSTQRAVLFGDPTKPGLFVERIKFFPGYKSRPHYHPDEMRTVVVLSGTIHFGVGEEWDEGKLKAFPEGTFYTEPPGMPHFAWVKDAEVIIQVTALGPTGMIPVTRRK